MNDYFCLFFFLTWPFVHKIFLKQNIFKGKKEWKEKGKKKKEGKGRRVNCILSDNELIAAEVHFKIVPKYFRTNRVTNYLL